MQDIKRLQNDLQSVYCQRGESIDWVNDTDREVKPNDIIVLGDRIGISGCNIPVGAIGSCHVEGTYWLKTMDVFTPGATVFWDDAAKSAVNTGTVKAGWACWYNSQMQAVLVKIN